jgi:uncharacterized repeat protein (TIGR03803 family)
MELSPTSGLVTDPAGNLYGETENGGSCGSGDGSGTVFELSPPTVSGAPWTESILYSFQGFCTPGKGSEPTGGLILDTAGALFGTTFFGGAHDAGSVFRLNPPSAGHTGWTETTLYSFNPADSGPYYPLGGVIPSKLGTLYATTEAGGGTANGCPTSQGCGAVVELSPPAVADGSWTATTIYAFTGGDDGAAPSVPLLADAHGNLYGTATEGGIGTCSGEQIIGGCGSIFELSPPATAGAPWTETTLHTFTGASPDQGLPDSSLILGNGGKLYGTTVGNNNGENRGLHGNVYFILP